MLLFEIILAIGFGLLLAEVLRLRARVSELERRARIAVPNPVVPADAGTSTSKESADVAGPGAPAVAGQSGEGLCPTHRGSRVRGNDGEGAGAWERLVGGRLLIWVGGAALALGGLFLVRYSIEVGLIGPGVRMALAAALGLAFLAGGEAARARMADEPRVAQALIGAGVLVLYATAYAAHLLYGFYGVATAFALMALVAAGGLALSLRHGWPTAALGLVGGLATPALVGEAGAVLPLLGYLLLLNAAVLWAARARGWDALLGAAVLGTAVWVAPLAATSEGGEAIAVGLFALGYALLASWVQDRARVAATPPGWLGAATRPAALGLVQLAILLAAQSFFVPGWLFYAVLAGAVLLLSRDDRPSWLPLGAAALGTALLWAQMSAGALYASAVARAPSPWLVAGGLILLFAPVAARRIRGRAMWTGVFAVAVAGPVLALRAEVADNLLRLWWGALLIGFALLPAALAWAVPTRGTGDPRRAGLFLTASALAGVGAGDLFAPIWTPAACAFFALALAGGARRLDDPAAARVAALTAGVALFASWFELARAPDWPDAGQATALLAAPGALLAGMALLTREPMLRRWLWAGAGLAGLAWAGVLARQLTGLARVLSFLALGGALVAAGRVWGRGRHVDPPRDPVIPANAPPRTRGSKSSGAGRT